MAKLYYTKDIKQLFNDQIKESAAKLVNDQWLDDSEITDEIKDLRKIQLFVDGVIASLEKADHDHDIEMDEWRAKQAAKAGDES